jgi:peptidoglycan/LPS O-acetylase OafA/YrhL
MTNSIRPVIALILAIALFCLIPIHDLKDLEIIRGVKGALLLLTTLGMVAAVSLIQLTRNWSIAVAKFLGEISYALYLSHFIIFSIITRFTADPLHQIVLTSLSTVIIAYAIYRLYERPFLRMGRKRRRANPL